MPLKTYLPQGDIDITSISHPSWERFPRDVYNALLDEQSYGNKEFEIQEIKFVDAEVILMTMLFIILMINYKNICLMLA